MRRHLLHLLLFLAPILVRADITYSPPPGAAFPPQAGHAGEALFTDGTNPYWSPAGGTITINPFGSTPNDNGLTFSGGALNMEPADSTHPGGVSATTQTFGGDKTFSGSVTFSANITEGQSSNGLSGTNATLNAHNTPIIRLTNGGLVSLAAIDNTGVNSGHVVTINNHTGNSIALVDNYASAPSGQKLILGYSENINLPDKMAVRFQYDSTSSAWLLLGGVKRNGLAGGSNTQVQYNNSGALAGDSGFVYDSSAKKVTVTKTSIGGGTTVGVASLVDNSTAATSGTQQNSPWVGVGGRSWLTNSLASTPYYFGGYAESGSSIVPNGTYYFTSSSNLSTFTKHFSITTPNASSLSFFTSLDPFTVSFTASNSSPGTTDHLVLSNPSGSYTHGPYYKFGSTFKAGTTVDSNGNVILEAAGNSGYTFRTGTIPGAFRASISSLGFYNSYSNYNAGSVTAGNSDTGATAKLSNYGSQAQVGRNISSNYTVTSSDYFLYCDTTNSANCTGTPAACSSYSDPTSCNAHSQVGCSFFVAGNCSDANFTNYTTCTDLNAACSWQTAACSAFNNDMSGCNSAGFPSGGQCTFTPATCADFGGSVAACNGAAGCSPEYSGVCGSFSDYASCSPYVEFGCSITNGNNCSTFDGDETSCNANNQGGTGCSWNPGDSTCSGNYFSSCDGSYMTSCTGSYSGGDGACTGSYDTGTCAGGDYGSCGGIAACSNLTPYGSSTCNAESGCSWTTGLTVQLPSIATITRGTSPAFVSWYLGIKKMNSGGGAVTYQTSGTDTLESGGSSGTISSQYGIIKLHGMSFTSDCSVFNGDESGCVGQNGCFWNSENSECSGEYISSRKWMFW